MTTFSKSLCATSGPTAGSMMLSVLPDVALILSQPELTVKSPEATSASFAFFQTRYAEISISVFNHNQKRKK